MAKILHAADLHLGSQLSGLLSYDGAPPVDVANATRRAFERLVDLAIAENVDLVLLAGDVFDQDWPDYNTGHHFLRQLSKLRDAGIQVVMIRGNHDAANVMTRHLDLKELCILLPHSKPKSVEFEEIGVVVHGQSYGKRAVTENLVRNYPPRWEGMFNIGILHTALDGREGHERYAPCTLADLDALNYDYWALGHVHTREEKRIGQGTLVVFPGNIQGRHCKEVGEKGVYILDTEADDLNLSFRAVHQVEWRIREVDLTGARNRDAVVDRLSAAMREFGNELPPDPELFAVRLEFVGETPLAVELRADHDWLLAEARSAAAHDGGERIWVEDVRVHARPGGGTQHAIEPSVLAAVQEAAQELRLDRVFDDEDLRDLRRKLTKFKIDVADLVAEDDLREDALAEVLRALRGS